MPLKWSPFTCAACFAIATVTGCGKSIGYELGATHTVAEPQFERSMGSLLGPPIVDGNSVTTLVNGDEIFPSMLEAIRAARETVTFETFIYWSGSIGGAFANALSERARAGVRVHVIVDGVGGEEMDHEYVLQMKDAGVQVEVYKPLRWHQVTGAHRLNYRTHRKLLIVDGRVGFTGGVGIADEWLGNAQSEENWRDTHYRIEGPVVAQLQSAFVDNWIEATGVVLDGEDYFPPLASVGTMRAQMFKSSAEGGNESMQLMYLMSIAAARDDVRLSSAYFVPDDATVQSLLEARRRGVHVQVIVPGRLIDAKFVRRASRARWGPLLAAGVEISEYQPTMFHPKLMIVDDLWVSVGSANLDNRSFKLNDEANLNVLDRQLAATQIRLFGEDLSQSERVTLVEWQQRPWHEKLLESFASLFGGQM